MWPGIVATADFQRALEASLKGAGLLSSTPQSSKYVLRAELVNLKMPGFGLDMTVTATVRYTLFDGATQKEVFGKLVSAPYTAKVGEALVGAERAKLASEGAVRTNIEQLIEALAGLQLSAGQVQLKR